MAVKRKFAKEFKLQVLEELDHKSNAQVCREHDLHPNLVIRWKKDYEKNPDGAFSGNGNMWKKSTKVAQYERIIGQLYTEISLLKKSIALNRRLRAEEKKRRWYAR